MLRNRLFRSFMLTAAMLFAVCTYFAYRTLTFVDTAEHNLQAVLVTRNLLWQYVEKKHEWPRSPADLDEIPSADSLIYHWPEDKQEILSRVQINFDLTIEEIAESDFDSNRLLAYSLPNFPSSANTKLNALQQACQSVFQDQQNTK